MKYTLIELVSRILESMDSDEVSDISQTVESLAVANIIKENYFDIVSKMDFPDHQGIFNLDASGDNLKPVLMSLPSNALEILTLKYNTETVSNPIWQDIQFRTLEDFMRITNSYDTSQTNVGSMELEYNGGNFVFKFQNDRHPTYYTTLDDRDILFDSFDSDVDSTLQKVKTFCYGGILLTFSMTNTYVPDLDARQFQFLLQESKAQAFTELKQVTNPTAEKKARRNEILAQRTKHAVDKRPGIAHGPRFGRK